ncbi:unnamed protein product [Phyllotreta striolata]|uniref:TOG domain-containing protein n=1 Tax=Phyllotreta striolata TaxID=444603 RepID=A0A9P0DRL4_PHYSR|nr:unnamed protein product [Phyllotreta striolata]
MTAVCEKKPSLTRLWETIVRTKNLPIGVDETFLYDLVREKLCEPEREVRQHALRVLMDLIPVTKQSNLDAQMRNILPNVLSNLGHSSPSLRKSALDSLKKYSKFSANYNYLMKELLPSTEHFTSIAPFLINPQTDDKTVKFVVEELWKDLENPNVTQDAAKALARLRFNIGNEKFKNFLGTNRHLHLEEICEIYDLPIDYSDNEKLWSDEDSIEDKVILETEITLKTGPAITMKIHEESRPSSVVDDHSKHGVLKILRDDSESDFEEVARRTPRKVRFGGESVKLRTPESDSSNQSDAKSTLRITVSDALSITTRKSLIPIRIKSLPTTPLRSSNNIVKNRLHRSAPNLNRSFHKTKLPLKRDSNLIEKFKINEGKDTLMDNLVVPKLNSRRNSVTLEPKTSPSSPHKEIEVFHNLTRSPVMQRKMENSTSNNISTFNSFKLFPDSTSNEDISIESTTNNTNENKILALPPPEDVRNSMGKSDMSAEKTNQLSSDSKISSSNEKINEYDSFKVCPNDSEYSSRDENLDTKKKQNGGFDLFQQWHNSSFNSEESSLSRSEALDNLVKMLKQPNTLENLEPGPAALLFEALFACQHLDKLHFLAEDAMGLMIRGVRKEVLDQCLGRLSIGICTLGAPTGINLALLLMKKCCPKNLLGEIMDRCFAHKTREGALQVLMASARLLPSSDIEVTKMAEFASATLRDRRRRVRHAALETLATLAQLRSNAEILEIVERVTKASPDHQYLLRVIRTRLSRRQLPVVESDGTVRYSTPRDQTELEWLSGKNNIEPNHSVSSSASSSNNSINYWKRNSRHEDIVESSITYTKDDSSSDRQQVWAVDPVVFHKNGFLRENNKTANPPVLRPVYILQPEAATDSGRGYRRYDRGRSFSPPKPNHKRSLSSYVAASDAQPLTSAPKAAGKCKEGVRKSFSSEQLFVKDRDHQELHSFSLSSRSSTTSTGSSSKSGNWYKEMRSGIPVPISSETKFRFRSNGTSSNSTSSGPIIARRSALGSVPSTPIITRSSPRSSPEKTSNVLPPPPQSSGSESSGYFTPPPDSKKAFVKLDSVDRTSESDDKDDDKETNNNNIEEEDTTDNAGEFVKRNLSASSAETTVPNEEPTLPPTNSSPSKSSKVETPKREQIQRFSISGSRESLFTEQARPLAEYRSKSRSVVDLQNFLPEITAIRKNLNSAPSIKDDLLSNGNITISTTEEIQAVIPINCVDDNPESPTKEITITRKLSRRLSRTQSRRSIRSTPREPTPNSSRSNIKLKDTLQLALNQLSNTEWEVMILGLQSLSRIAKYHPEVIEGQIHTVCVNLAKHIKNLRSQVARAACHTATELFASCRRSLEIELEEIAGPLLHRTADTNKFLRSDANAALDQMCEHLPISRVVAVITSRGCTHQNSIVRAASIRLITDLVKRHGSDKIFQMNKDVRDKIILAGANSLADGSVEARSHGKEMLSHLMVHPMFHKTLLEVVPQSTLRHIAKTLNSIKAHGGT